MGRLGVTEILIILAVVLLLFGGKKIPELMKGLGSGIKEFKNAAKDDSSAKKEEDTAFLLAKFRLVYMVLGC
jgi:sec-independent protein translocase protein TatA